MPRAVGVVALLAGAGFVAWGQFIGVTAAVGLGVVLLAALLLDLIFLLLLMQWASQRTAPQVTPNPAQAGETITVILAEAVSSSPHLPVRCQLHDPWRGVWQDAAPIDRKAHTPDVTCPMTAKYRGKWDVGLARWTTASPLGLWVSRRRSRATSELTVWPATEVMDVPPPRETEGSVGLGPMKAHLDDTTLREYVPGDDLRRVHWRSLARANTLMTRAEEPSRLHRTVGALQAEAGADLDAVDLAVSLLASWGISMLSAKQEFDLDLGVTRLRNPTRSRLLETLTELEPSGGCHPDDATDADDALLVVAAGPSVAPTIPAIARAGVAVVIGPPEAPVTAPVGWQAVRVVDGTSLKDAADAVEQALFGASGTTGARR